MSASFGRPWGPGLALPRAEELAAGWPEAEFAGPPAAAARAKAPPNGQRRGQDRQKYRPNTHEITHRNPLVSEMLPRPGEMVKWRLRNLALKRKSRAGCIGFSRLRFGCLMWALPVQSVSEATAGPGLLASLSTPPRIMIRSELFQRREVAFRSPLRYS